MNWKALFSEFLRGLVALVFLFSGFVKGVDPWGTAIKVGEYMQVFGLDFLLPTQYAVSVMLSAGEMLLGLGLLFHLGGRLFPRLVLLVSGLFTLLTLVLVIWNPVSDCGCFGDAIKLTNEQTFVKNLVLLLIAAWVWWVREKEGKGPVNKDARMVEWSMGFLFVLFAVGVGAYSLRHLPLIDFLPFKVGVHIPTALKGGASGEQQTILVYRDKESGQEREFALSDTTWYDTLRWEFVDTRFVELAPAQKPTITEFSIFNATGDAAQWLLATPEEWFMVTMTSPERITPRCQERLAGLADYAASRGVLMVGVTSDVLPQAAAGADTLAPSMLTLGRHRIPLYNIDATTLKTVIRTHVGVVLFKEGTILGKWTCRDIPDFGHDEPSMQGALSWLAATAQGVRMRWMLGVMGVLLVLLYVSCFVHRRR